MSEEAQLGQQEIEQLADLLRRTRPVHVVAIMLDGTERKIAAAQGRSARWRQMAELVASFAADVERVELRDRSNAVLGTWQPMREVAESSTSVPTSGMSAEQAFALRTVEMVQRATDHAVDRHTKAVGPLLDGFVSLARLQDQRIATLERMVTSLMRQAQQQFADRLAAEAAAVEAAQDDPMRLLGEGLAAVGQMQGLVNGAAPGGAPKAP